MMGRMVVGSGLAGKSGAVVANAMPGSLANLVVAYLMKVHARSAVVGKWTQREGACLVTNSAKH